MRLIHNLTFSNETKIKKELKKIGINFKDNINLSFLNFKIDENDIKWADVKLLKEKYKAVDIVTKKFSTRELNNAEWFELNTTWYYGYPEPSDDFGYRSKTYDLTNYCEVCGIGKIQKAPFYIKGEPRWGKVHILQLDWIYDEFFVKTEVWEDLFKPFGINCIPVLNIKTNQKLKTIVQLDINTILKDNLIIDNMSAKTCLECKRKKYLLENKVYTIKKNIRNFNIAKSIEYFGGGASASRAVLISKGLYLKMKQYKLKGAKFIPIFF